MRDIYDSKDKVSIYCDHRYSTWAQRGISGREHGLLTSLLEELPRAERILDIPVGYGRFTPLLLPHTDCLLSFDLSPRMLVKAAERQQDLDPELAGKIHLAGANIGWLPLAVLVGWQAMSLPKHAARAEKCEVLHTRAQELGAFLRQEEIFKDDLIHSVEGCIFHQRLWFILRMNQRTNKNTQEVLRSLY